MKEKHKKLVIGWLIIFAIIYLFCAFVALDPNPASYPTAGRLVFSVATLSGGIIWYFAWDDRYN